MKLVHLWLIILIWQFILIIGLVVEATGESRNTIDNIAMCAMFLAYSLVPIAFAIAVERVVKYNREYNRANKGVTGNIYKDQPDNTGYTDWDNKSHK